MSEPIDTAPLTALCREQEAYWRDRAETNPEWAGGVENGRADLFAALAAALEQGERDAEEATTERRKLLTLAEAYASLQAQAERDKAEIASLRDQGTRGMASLADGVLTRAEQAEARAEHAEVGNIRLELARDIERDQRQQAEARADEYDRQLCVAHDEVTRHTTEIIRQSQRADRLEQALRAVQCKFHYLTHPDDGGVDWSAEEALIDAALSPDPKADAR